MLTYAGVCPLPAGVDVVCQGTAAHAFYVISEGEVLVHGTATM